MQVYKWHHTASWEFLVSSAPRKSPRGMVFLFATARRSMRADSGSFVQMRRQSPCQYVNYCLRSFPCLCANSLAVRLPSPASPLLRSYFFTTATEPLPSGGYGVLKGEIECTSRGECCSPTFPSGFPPPLGIGDNPPKMRDMLFVLFDKVLVSHRDNRAANSTH